jgi:hypothetical protein
MCLPKCVEIFHASSRCVRDDRPPSGCDDDDDDGGEGDGCMCDCLFLSKKLCSLLCDDDVGNRSATLRDFQESI